MKVRTLVSRTIKGNRLSNKAMFLRHNDLHKEESFYLLDKKTISILYNDQYLFYEILIKGSKF